MEFEAPLYENNTIVNVMNFGVNMTNDRLRRMFEKYGSISSYGIMNDDEAWRRFAYVAFEDSDAADEAVIELNGQRIDDDRRIRVRRTRKRNEKRSKSTAWSRDRTKNNDEVAAAAAPASSSSSSSSSVENPPKDRDDNSFSVYVENLDKSVDRVQLRNAFRSFGTIIESRVIMEGEGTAAKSRGFGFVTFAREEDANRAIIEKTGCLIGTKAVRVEMSRSKSKFLASGSIRPNFIKHAGQQQQQHLDGASRNVENSPRGFHVHVKNLDRAVNAAQLRQAFESCGRIVWAKIIMDREGSRGFGFVEFSTEEAARKAINEKSGIVIGSQTIQVQMSRGYNKNGAPGSPLQNSIGELRAALRGNWMQTPDPNGTRKIGENLRDPFAIRRDDSSDDFDDDDWH